MPQDLDRSTPDTAQIHIFLLTEIMDSDSECSVIDLTLSTDSSDEDSVVLLSESSTSKGRYLFYDCIILY